MDPRSVPDILLQTPEFGRNAPKTREELFNRARHFLSVGVDSEKAQEELSRILEQLYRHASNPGQLAALDAWLRSNAGGVTVTEPWLALVQLARTREPQRLLEPLRIVDRTLAHTSGRTALVLQTEAARHMRRISSNPHAAWARMADQPTPDPVFGDAATENMALRLRLAAEEGAWVQHHRVARSAQEAWGRLNQPLPPLLRLILAEHELKRGRYAAALDELSLLLHSTAPDLRLAALQIRLHALIACADLQDPAELDQEILDTSGQLAPLARRTWSAQETYVLPAEERAWRQHQARLLLKHAIRPAARSTSEEPDQLPGLAELTALAATDPERALLKCRVAINQDSYRELPEVDLRLRLLRIRLTLQLQGSAMALTCEGLVNQVLSTAETLNLPILELLAYEQRSTLRARYFDDRWRAVAADAAQAAYLATRVVAMNRGSLLETALRHNIAPLFEHVVELLVESSLHIGDSPDAVAQRATYGRFVLDYIEQNLQLELEEARFSTWQDSHSHGLTYAPSMAGTTADAEPKTITELRQAIAPQSLVLQYFLVRRFVLIFVYGHTTFQWHAQPLPPEGKAGGARHWLRQQVRRLARETGKVHRERLHELSRELLPASIVQALKQEDVHHLAIVPDQILYRLPFRQLLLQRGSLPGRCRLSIQVSGQEAVQRQLVDWQRAQPRPRALLAVGPGMQIDVCAPAAEALESFSELDKVQIEAEGWQRFRSVCPGSDLLALAWTAETQESLPELLHLPLETCGLVVLPTTWDLWGRVRDHPGLLLPQQLLDRGAVTVISSLGRQSKARQIIWLTLFARALAFLDVGDALVLSQRWLARISNPLPGNTKVSTEPSVEDDTEIPGELRLTGRSDLRLAGRPGAAARLTGFLHFYGWLASQFLRRSLPRHS